MPEFDQLQIRKMDGGLLLIFRELLIRRRATDVADRLGLSPSAISHSLVRLRDLFGDPLFIRRSHGLEPTQRAIELGPAVEALIGGIQAIVSDEAGFDPALTRRRFRIACPDDIVSLIGQSLIETFRREAPEATFSARPVFLDRALRAVRRGEADLALGAFGTLPRGFTGQTLYRDEYCVIAREGHPAVQGGVDLTTYLSVGHLFVGIPDGALADEAPFDREAISAAYGPMPGPGVVRTHGYVTQWETAMLIVSESDVLADCPRRLAERFAGRLGLQILAPPFKPFAFTVQAVRRAEPADPGVDWLLTRIAAAVSG